jgi:adenylate cyclase
VPDPISLTARASVTLPPERIWAFLSDTDRMNRAISLPAIRFVPIPDPSKKGHFRAETHVLGMLVEYEEFPWNWVEPRYYEMKRRFASGPIEEIRGGIRMEPTSSGTDLEAWASITPRSWIGKLAAKGIGAKAGKEIVALVRAFEAHARDEQAAPAPGLPPPANVNVDVLEARLAASGVTGPADRLKAFLLTASDLEVIRMRPYMLADQWGEDRTALLRYFLHIARSGVLDLAWSVLCPSCRVATSRTRKLSEMKSKAHCDTCQIEFGADLAASIEARFSVNPAVRRARTETFCIGGPANMPDILAQLRLEPGEKRREVLPLKRGGVRIRCYQSPGVRELKVGSGGTSVSVRCRPDGLQVDVGQVAEGPVAVDVENPLAVEALLVVERETWKDLAATAAVVTSLQEFRDLFPAEAVAPGEELAVASLAVLFTDLKGSTDLYQRAGDPRAFTLVQNHFRYLTETVAACRGGVVKTMGDAIMAVFGSGRDAVEAAVRMQRGWCDFQEGRPDAEGILLKVGVHQGTSIAINNVGRLDYFGTTVNTAARVQGQATGGDIVMSAGLAEDPDVKKYLIAEGLRSEESRAWLKGLAGEHRLIRLRLGG